MAELTPEDKYNLGLKMGEAIAGMFVVMAKVDGVSFNDAVDEWVAHWVASRIIEEATGDADATTG